MQGFKPDTLSFSDGCLNITVTFQDKRRWHKSRDIKKVEVCLSALISKTIFVFFNTDYINNRQVNYNYDHGHLIMAIITRVIYSLNLSIRIGISRALGESDSRST